MNKLNTEQQKITELGIKYSREKIFKTDNTGQMADIKKIETLAQRGLTDKEIRLAMRLDILSPEEKEAIERGRASGIALINDKLFKRALAGDPKAVDYLNKKFATLNPDPPGKSYIDRQLEILRNLT